MKYRVCEGRSLHYNGKAYGPGDVVEGDDLAGVSKGTLAEIKPPAPKKKAPAKKASKK